MAVGLLTYEQEENNFSFISDSSVCVAKKINSPTLVTGIHPSIFICQFPGLYGPLNKNASGSGYTVQ